MKNSSRWVLSLGVLLSKRFDAGQTTQTNEAAELLMLPNDITSELMFALEKASSSTGLEPSLRELVKLRVSQINGCAFCVDLHSRDARKAGSTQAIRATNTRMIATSAKIAGSVTLT